MGETERTGKCKADSTEFAVQIRQSQVISKGFAGEGNMLNQIRDSPMSICVDAEPWQLYVGGVIDASICGTELDHCVHLVGYKGDGGDDYWIVKNSWASNWGEDGYIRVQQGENACGIAEEATVVSAFDEKKPGWSKKYTSQDVIDFVEGLALGMGFPMGDECIDAATDLMIQMDAAYDLIEERTAISMAKAVKLIAVALAKDVTPATKSCGATKKQIMDLIDALDIMEHPKEFVYHMGKDLVLNGVDIYNEINASVAYKEESDYSNMGKSIGEALNLIIVGKKMKAGQSGELFV